MQIFIVPFKVSFILLNKWDCSVAGLNCVHFANVTNSPCKEMIVRISIQLAFFKESEMISHEREDGYDVLTNFSIFCLLSEVGCLCPK